MLDINLLKQPLSETAPTGRDLRNDSSATAIYYQIKDARAAARTAERKAAEQHEDQNALKDWQVVYQLGIEILSKHSKDLEVCAWLTEAALRLEGLAGLTAGFQLTHDLIANFWAQLYPLADEDGISSKVAALAGLNGLNAEGTLIVPIFAVEVTEGSSKGPYALWQYQQALEIEKITDAAKRQKRLQTGGTDLADIKTAVAETDVSFYQQLRQDLSQCQQAFAALTGILTEQCGRDAPPSSQIKKSLESFAEHLTFILADAPFKLPEATSKNTVLAVAAASPEQPTVERIVMAEPIASETLNRDQALKSLAQIAQFFAKTEPHSPLPFLLQRAVRWGNLALPELLKELISDDNARGNVCRLTGIEINK
jgi:type VI secretion system protein ImpA